MNISKAVILGLGSSGEAASLLLRKHGCAVRVLEQSGGDEIERRAAELLAAGVEVLVGLERLEPDHFTMSDGQLADACVLSPGVPADSAWVEPAAKLGIPLVSELDVGFSYADCPLIAVTGSNGKSTLVKLLNETVQALGMQSAPCGNYGDPLSDVVARETQWDRLVVEVSTFQMETSKVFAPQTGVLLNLQPNHLDRHESMDDYANLKAKMIARVPVGGVAVVHRDQVEMVKALGNLAELVTIGEGSESDYFYSEGVVEGKGKRIDVAGTFADNSVMGLTAAAAMAVVVENGWSTEALEGCIRGFEPLDFRMQAVGVIDGVKFINNSKATTLAALEASLRMVNGPIRLICGGKLKEKDLQWIKKSLVKTGASAYLYGQAGSELCAAWSDSISCEVFDDLHDATTGAFSHACSGDVVILSPGCASFDQYIGYADRGRDFNRVLEKLRR
jgi:UDP-N-acetylmuramoylalanine--D-glutamate ligase